MAPVLQEVLAANETYAASFGDKGKLAMPLEMHVMRRRSRR